jgi:hypothetical protein
VLDYAEREYREARFHYALMLNDPFSRGWVLFELMVRILAAMLALDLARPEDMVPFILRRDPIFTRLVIVPGLTDINNDVTGKLYDRFGQMALFDPMDKITIKRRIVEACGSPHSFNMLIAYGRAAGIQDHFQVPQPDQKSELPPLSPKSRGTEREGVGGNLLFTSRDGTRACGSVASKPRYSGWL